MLFGRDPTPQGLSRRSLQWDATEDSLVGQFEISLAPRFSEVLVGVRFMKQPF